MRILILGKYFPPHKGGIETYTYDVSKELVKRKNDVWVIVSNEKNIFSFEKIKGIKVIRLPMLFQFIRGFLTPPLFNYIKKIKPQIIHLNVPNPWFEFNVLLYCIFNPNKKIIITYHSDIINYTIVHRFFNFFRYFMLFPLLKFYTFKIIATSNDYAESSIFLRYSKNKLEIMPIPIDLKNFEPEKLQNKKIKKIFFVGRLVKYKGVEYLIKAAFLLSKKRHDFKVIIIGDGPLKYKLKKMTKELNLEKMIIFTGKVSNGRLKNMMKKECDIFVLPSIYRSEALGLALVEAMALEKPVISTKIKGSGINFVNINNVTGLVVEPQNHEQLADAIEKLLNDYELRKKFGKNGRKRVFKFFNLNKYIQKLTRIYDEYYKNSE